MAYTTPLTAVTGATFTAAQWNSSARDNLSAIWVGTTAGDMDYYTSSSAKTRIGMTAGSLFRSGGAGVPQWLPMTAGDLVYRGASYPVALNIGTAGKILASDGSAPSWALPLGVLDAIGLAQRTATTELTATTWADVANLTTTLALTAGATYTVFGILLGTVATDENGTGDVRLMIDGTAQTTGTETTLTSAGAQWSLAVGWYRTGIASGNRIVKAQYQHTSGSLYIRGNLIAFAVREAAV